MGGNSTPFKYTQIASKKDPEAIRGSPNIEVVVQGATFQIQSELCSIYNIITDIGTYWMILFYKRSIII